MDRSELVVFLKYGGSVLLVFITAIAIQVNVIRGLFEPKFMVLPVIISLFISSLFGYTAVLKMRLQESNRAKSEFLSRMSHELRTPLNAILGFAQIQKMEAREKGDAAQLDNSAEILQAGQHLLELIDELLDLSRIESGMLELQMEAVDPAEVVKECLAILYTMIAQREIIIEWSDESLEKPPAINADRKRLREVILNLLSNAVKYNKRSGSVRISITEEPKERVRIQIEDTGIGIPAGEFKNVYIPFSRGSQKQGNVEGIGIGLGISKKLVELMGGSIGFDSKENEGSVFWIYLKKTDQPQ